MEPLYSWSLRTATEEGNENKTLWRLSHKRHWISTVRLHGWSQICQTYGSGHAELCRDSGVERGRRMEGRTTRRRPDPRKVVGAVWRCNVKRDRRAGGLVQPKSEDRRGESTPSPGSDSLQSRRASTDHWKFSQHLRHSSFRQQTLFSAQFSQQWQRRFHSSP